MKCLRTGHSVNECRSGNCCECNGRHHTLLHRENKSTAVTPVSSTSTLQTSNLSSPQNPVTGGSSKTSLSIVSIRKSTTVVLPTAVVYVTLQSKFVLARVMLDSGFQAAFITEDFVCKHRLPSIGDSSSRVTSIRSFEISVNADIVHKILFSISDYRIR